ncbi:MAG: DUF3080 domain-containing protein [Pseudomonadaceae bacterium]|nr:DUF3080 domain-containing protein [Pseudomonadaceae bacterium]
MVKLIRTNRTVVLLIALVYGLAACGGPDSSGEQYLQRISQALDRPVITTPVELIPYPSRRSLQRSVPALNISVAQFARLHACDMGGLLGARNGSLARLAQDSQRLLYELSWLQAAQLCIVQGQEWLQPLVEQKTSSLPDALWNATFASAELGTAMGQSAASAGHSVQADQHFRRLADQINSALQHDRQSLENDFESTLRQLSLTARVGARRQYWSTLRAQLQAVSDALSQREPPVCLSGLPNDRSRRLLAVFQRYYVSLWQVEFSQLLSADERWLTALARSVDMLQNSAPLEFQTWYDNTLNMHVSNSEWQRTKQAVADHVQAWQGLFEQCGIDVATLRGTT